MNAKRHTEFDFSKVGERPQAKKVNVPTPKVSKPQRFTPAVMQAPAPAPAPIVIPKDINRMTVRRAALAYAKAGIYVLPVARGTKNPGSLVHDWTAESSTDPEVIQAWFDKWPDANVGIHPGKSGLLVFDLDKADKLSQLPPAIAEDIRLGAFQRSRTLPGKFKGARGHYVFTDALGAGNSAGGWAPWGDVRGANGFIMAAPSIHPETGEPYTWVRSGEVPAVPVGLRDLIGVSSLEVHEALSSEELEEFLTEHDAGDDVQYLTMMVSAFKGHVQKGESRHNTMQGTLVGAFRDARGGRYPAQLAYDTLKAVYDEAFRGSGRTPSSGEFHSMALWAASQPDQEEITASLWDMTPELRAVYETGAAWGVAPMALLGEGLMRALLAVPPSWYLPPIIGAPAPVNAFIVRVANPGLGKSSAENLARQVFVYDDPATETDIARGTVGSGEGVGALYGKRGKPPGKPDGDDAAPYIAGYRHTRAHVRFGEITQFETVMGRQGSTLSQVLLEQWSGMAFGNTVNDASKTHHIEFGRYRLVLSVGAQPSNVGAVLSKLADGLPQRFLWVSAVDTSIGKATNQPGDTPAVIRLPTWKFKPEAWRAAMGTPVPPEQMNFFIVPPLVRELVIEANYLMRTAELHAAPSLAAHRLLLMEKVALAFAVLHGETTGFSMEHWGMAERFMLHSDALIKSLFVATGRAKAEVGVYKAEQKGMEEALAEGAKDAAMRDQVRERVLGMLQDVDWATGGTISRNLSAGQKAVLAGVLDQLRSEGLIKRKQVGTTRKGWSYALV